MPEANVEAVRSVYESWSKGDFRAGVPFFDEHVVFVIRPEFPDPGTYVGPEAVAGYTRGLLEAWTLLTLEAEEIVDAGDTVIVALVQRGVGASSGTPTEFRYFHVWSFRGPKVIRLENFRERAEALAAAGISK
jgi:ketosteroid isomerase-like protein